MIKKLFNFDEMVTPKVIKIIFWIGIVLIAAYSLFTFVLALNTGENFLFLFGILAIIIGPIMLRVYCEMIIIMFKIYEEIKKIR